MSDRIHLTTTSLHSLRLKALANHDLREADKRAAIEMRALDVIQGTTDPVLREILELHRPVIERSASWPACLGCDNDDGPDADPADWPCSTWILIERHASGIR